MSFAWNFLRQAHAHVAEKKFLAAGTPDRPDLPASFFYSAPMLAVQPILSNVSTDTMLEWLSGDDLLAYRFLGAPWPETRSNAAELMNRDVIEPVADVMLMILEREFGITGNRDKMLCLEQFRDRLQRDFFTWIREGSINSVQQLLFSLINDAEPNKRSYVISGGVVFRHNPADDSLSFTSVVALYRFVGPSFESVLLKPKAPMWRATQGFF